MECANTTEFSNYEYLLQFKKKIENLRVPLSGDIALTHRCNLRCVHCYLGSERKNHRANRKELNTSQFLTIIDDITETGCLFLLLTGGEPLLRKDFAQIYSHAKTNGLLVTIFTNGTVITDDILDVFEALPPLAVEVSLYGATPETYEKVTGVQGSYDQCVHNIQRLLDRHINVRLKTVLMSLNRHEFFDIEAMARQYDCQFRMDAALLPCFDGDKTPLMLRVPAEEAVEKELAHSERLRQWQELFKRFQGVPAGETLYTCGAGISHFHVDPYGYLLPCMMVSNISYDLLQGSFASGWSDVIPQITEMKASSTFACNHCKKKVLCGYCPAFFALENGAEDICSEYLCSIGQFRFQALERIAQCQEE